MPVDPWTGVEPGIAHPGWVAVAQGLARWLAAPGGHAFLKNGLLAREELLQRTDLDPERRAWYAWERELYAQALTGKLQPEVLHA